MNKAYAGEIEWEDAMSWVDTNGASVDFNVADLAPQIQELVEVLQDVQSLQGQLLENYNATRWGPMIDELLNAYAENLPEVVLRVLGDMEPLLKDSAFWKELQTSLRAASQYMKWINDQLESLNQTVDITSLFPSESEVRQLLTDVIGPRHAAEFLTLALQPDRVLLVIQSDLADIFCNETVFNDIFTYPEGTDVVALRDQLCGNAQNGSLVIQQVADLFSLQTLANQLAAMTGTSPETETQSPVMSLITQINRFVKNAELVTRLLSLFDSNMPNEIASYLSSLSGILTMVENPTVASAGELCDSVYNLVDEIPEVKEITWSLLANQEMQSIIAEVVQFVSKLDEFMCELPKLDAAALLLKLGNAEIWNLNGRIENFMDRSYMNSTDGFSCSATIHAADSVQLDITRMVTNNSFAECYAELTTTRWALADDANNTQALVVGIAQLLNSDLFASLQWLEPVRPLLEFIMQDLLQVNGDLARITDIVNTTALMELLQDGVEADVLDKLLNSVVDVDELMRVLNASSTSAAFNYLCDDTNGVAGPLSNITSICDSPQTLTQLLQVVKDNLDTEKIADLVSSTTCLCALWTTKSVWRRYRHRRCSHSS